MLSKCFKKNFQLFIFKFIVILVHFVLILLVTSLVYLQASKEQAQIVIN